MRVSHLNLTSLRAGCRERPILQRGFTLIELVVVIAILGVLAAVAAPKFFALQTEARKAALSGLRAAVGSAALMPLPFKVLKA